MIFAIQNIGGVGKDHGMPMCFYMGSRETFGSCWNNVMVATTFVDTYENKDGTPFNWEDWFPGFTTNDNVKKQTFRAELKNNKTEHKKETLAWLKYREEYYTLNGDCVYRTIEEAVEAFKKEKK